ncbi:MAG: hypothetical protein Q9169_002956 [Polycauliona sp. 2 TL-2023]
MAGRLPQVPLRITDSDPFASNISIGLFDDLEQLSRIVDIAYCVGALGLGIQKPFQCASRCQDFQGFELVKDYVPYPGGNHGDHAEDKPRNPPRCDNCTVHAGFMASWRHTRPLIIDDLKILLIQYPSYRLTLVGHSLGGAVAALASLDFYAHGWNPQVTTFGEPRIGNFEMTKYIDETFYHQSQSNKSVAYRRVTHVHDPVPWLPPEEFGYRTHGEELYISKANLPPERNDVRLCEGDEDPQCLGGGVAAVSDGRLFRRMPSADIDNSMRKMKDHANNLEMPARFRLWQLFFAHRDYFWRLGLCIPGGGAHDWR